VLQKAELSGQADSENDLGGSSETMYYIGLDVHKKTISYCVKDAAGQTANRKFAPLTLTRIPTQHGSKPKDPSASASSRL
jgi:hypothetical protein